MMHTDSFHSLWREYQNCRRTSIDEDQFAALLYTFPSALVAQADGRIDRVEKKFMKMLPDVLTAEVNADIDDQHIEASLTEDYFKEINYLLKHREEWEIHFLETLREELHNSLHERNAIFRSMWLTADSSADISAEERLKIDELTKTLGL